MTAKPPVPQQLPRLSYWLTGAGMMAERVLQCFWPLMSVVMLVLAALMLGLQDLVQEEVVWTIFVISGLSALVALVWGARKLHRPTRAEVLTRLDATLAGRPIQSLTDTQTLGAQDAASVALWQAHQARMAERAASAKPVQPDLKLSSRDPYALRYLALLGFLVALVFGSVSRIESVAGLTVSTAGSVNGPSWEGWIEPPRYTGLPTLYLNDQPAGELVIPDQSRVVLRFYGEVGALQLAETVSANPATDVTAPEQELVVTRDGTLEIAGDGGQSWAIRIKQDLPPVVAVSGEVETRAEGRMALPFAASDDYGVSSGQARIELDLPALARRHGLEAEPDPRDAIIVDLPMPIAGDRSDFTETLIEDFSQHPWAHLPVRVTLSVQDAGAQKGQAAPLVTLLTARRFFDPLAAAIVEQRRDLLWAKSNAPRVAMLLRAISHRPEDLFRSSTGYLRYRVILRRLEAYTRAGLTSELQDEIAAALWDLAILLEDGNLGDALERMRRAQERLSEAMKNGASDEEIAELMRELREATDDYLRQLSRQAQQGGDEQQGQQGETLQMSQDDLQRMMDRIQELMEQGRMAEAEQALREFQEMMENMRVTQGQQGQSDGQRAMEGLADTLRNQQGLSDQAFRDLQEQFNPGAQAGESQENQGRDGGQGRGQSHSGQGGSGAGDGEQGDEGAGSLADRQQALRDELRRQQQNMPGAGTAEGEATREALDRAGRAMEGAEEALRQNDMAEALDQQSEAMEALREGMRALGEAMAQDQQQRQPGQGAQEGDAQAQNRDPLGRQPGSQGGIDSSDNMLQGGDVYRRARELLDEIRRRAGEGERPQIELDYLKRLLERF